MAKNKTKHKQVNWWFPSPINEMHRLPQSKYPVTDSENPSAQVWDGETGVDSDTREGRGVRIGSIS